MDAIFQYDASIEDDYYKIIGCDELSSTEQIISEYKARVRDIHPDKNPGNKDAASRFARLQKAKETLCEEEKRTDYDRWRHSGMSICYEEWRSRRDMLKTSLHWAFLPKKDAAIEGAERLLTDTFSEQHQDVPWRRDHGCDSLQQFRNYKI